MHVTNSDERMSLNFDADQYYYKSCTPKEGLTTHCVCRSLCREAPHQMFLQVQRLKLRRLSLHTVDIRLANIYIEHPKFERDIGIVRVRRD